MSDDADSLLPEEKPRRKKPDQAEHGLSHWVDTFMERAFLLPGWFTAIEGGTWLPGATREARMNFETRRRARGIKPDHLDWYCWQQRTGRYVQFELKVEGRPATRGQQQTMDALHRQGIPTAVCETVPEVCQFLADAGFALHGNARGIAAELHEQYLGKRREASQPGKKKIRARKTGPRSAASSGFQRRAAARGILV